MAKKEFPEKDEKAAPEEPEAAEKMEDLEDEDEDEKEQLKGKKKAKKAAAALNPEESEAKGSSSEGSISPDQGVPSTQNVFTPQSSVSGKREQETPMGKAAPELDLQKSPLFVGISKQMDAMQETMTTKMEAMEKSMTDRLSNIKKEMEKVEKFYSQSFYKAAGENVGAEGVQLHSVEKQMADGKVRYSS